MAGTVADAVDVLVRAVQRYAPISGSWDLATLPAFGASCIFVDGWLSQANHQHLAPIFQNHVQLLEQENGRIPTVSAFSYAREGLSYAARDTCNDIEEHIEQLVDFLKKSAPNSVLVAYSIGGAVALLALQRLLADPGKEWLRATFPLVILMHPAIGGCEELAESLEDDLPLMLPQVPPIIQALAFANSKFPVSARQAFTDLLETGVAVNVLYCPADTFAPYPAELPNEKRAWHSDFSIRPASPYLEHVHLRGLSNIRNLLYYMAKPLLSWQ